MKMSQTRTIYVLIHCVLPLFILFTDMGSSRAVYAALFGKNIPTIACNKFPVIFVTSSLPPWMTPMNFSRYTSMCVSAAAHNFGERWTHTTSCVAPDSADLNILSRGK